ncbi:DMT family transporter [Leucobacter weissii]|uniref:DMT family transporter n=1 Tax=Leucobacter weissii TaxID=1983706 RepID=A0A939MLN1_9MICO|nr:DMT family transporter [Leucobacter weissii]
MRAARGFSFAGFVLAIGSAACFALSGIFASALISSGWSPGAATTARILFAALALLIPTLVMLRGQWSRVLRAWRTILLFGLLAIVACQLSFFVAVQFIPPSLALLIEFMGPVLLMLWTWARTRLAPSGVTLLGAALAVLGLVAISGVLAGGALNPLGILFALVAAVGNAAYFATGASQEHGIAPLPFVGLGLALAAVGLGIVSAVGLLPFRISSSPVTIADAEVPAAAAVAGMVLVSTVCAYVLGVAASRRLGATVASFTGYSEAMFGIVWTIVLLSVVPTAIQWLGAALIIAGVVTVKVGELLRSRSSPRVGSSRRTTRNG